jgi:hypothetical protein
VASGNRTELQHSQPTEAADKGRVVGRRGRHHVAGARYCVRLPAAADLAGFFLALGQAEFVPLRIGHDGETGMDRVPG